MCGDKGGDAGGDADGDASAFLFPLDRVLSMYISKVWVGGGGERGEKRKKGREEEKEEKEKDDIYIYRGRAVEQSGSTSAVRLCTLVLCPNELEMHERVAV